MNNYNRSVIEINNFMKNIVIQSLVQIGGLEMGAVCCVVRMTTAKKLVNSHSSGYSSLKRPLLTPFPFPTFPLSWNSGE